MSWKNLAGNKSPLGPRGKEKDTKLNSREMPRCTHAGMEPYLASWFSQTANDVSEGMRPEKA